jgi:hypothetical protein
MNYTQIYIIICHHQKKKKNRKIVNNACKRKATDDLFLQPKKGILKEL